MVITMTHFLAKIYFSLIRVLKSRVPIKILQFLSRAKIQKCLM